MGKYPKFLAILCALFLTSACLGKDVQIEVLPQAVEILIPPQNQTCPRIPPAPNPDTATQRDVAAWLPGVYAAHDECRTDLLVVSRIVAAHNEEARRQAEANATLISEAE